MKYRVPFRVTVDKPLSGVTMRVQKGKDELHGPSTESDLAISFDFDITVDIGDSLNFLGKFAQGPKDARFVYVNSGTYAGQVDTCWSRRAKLSLMSITRRQIEEVVAKPGFFVEATIPGVSPDGGPTCASVKNIEWKVRK